MNVNPDVNFEELARSTDDFNGAQLKAVCVEAGMLALRRDGTEVCSICHHFSVYCSLFSSFFSCFFSCLHIIALTNSSQILTLHVYMTHLIPSPLGLFTFFFLVIVFKFLSLLHRQPISVFIVKILGLYHILLRLIAASRISFCLHG